VARGARTAAAFVALWLSLAAAASAHHSAAATYSADESIAVRGAVVALYWTNPHCHVSIDVADGPFKGRTFIVELGSPVALSAEGWRRETLRPGDDVVMTVHPSRSGAAAGLCRQCAVTINGKSLRSRAPQT
jgi:hypothetical protein